MWRKIWPTSRTPGRASTFSMTSPPPDQEALRIEIFQQHRGPRHRRLLFLDGLYAADRQHRDRFEQLAETFDAGRIEGQHRAAGTLGNGVENLAIVKIARGPIMQDE